MNITSLKRKISLNSSQKNNALKRVLPIFCSLLVGTSLLTAQELDETLTLDFVDTSISYPADWTGTKTSDIGFNIKENADDSNIFTATGAFILGVVRGESLVPGTTLDNRVAAFIKANELEDVEAELRSTENFEYGHAVLGNRQFILTPLDKDFLMLQIADPNRAVDDPLLKSIIESVTIK